MKFHYDGPAAITFAIVTSISAQKPIADQALHH